MKPLIAVLLAAVLLLTMAGCVDAEQENENVVFASTDRTHSNHPGVELRIAGITRDEKGLLLEVEWISHSKEETVFGSAYTIERLAGGLWVSCATVDELVFDALGYVLMPGQTRKEAYRPEAIFDLSKPGTYRFRSECDRHELWAEFTVVEAPVKDKVQSYIGAVPFSARYLQSHAYREQVKYPQVLVIQSVEELEAAMGNGSRRDEAEASDPTDPKVLYDAAFFASKYLVVVVLQEGSGSIRHEVKSVEMTAEGQLAVSIDVIVPELGTCDMVEQAIILELDADYPVTSEQAVQVYLDNRLSWGGELMVPPITHTGEILRKPPALTLHHSGGSTAVGFAGCNWCFLQKDGSTGAVIGEHGDPLMMQNSLKELRVSGESVKLSFGKEPDEWSVVCWPHEDWVDGEAESHAVSGFENGFVVRPGGWIYAIRATWNNDGANYYGTAEYYVYIVTDPVPDHPLARE